MTPYGHLDPNPSAQPRPLARPLAPPAAHAMAHPMQSRGKDDRIAKARKARAKRARGQWAHKRGQLVAALALVALMGGAGVWGATGGARQINGAALDSFEQITAGLGLALSEVQVSGRRLTSESDILAAVGAYRGTPALTFDLGDAKARLESLPWVIEARITRHLPRSLEIVLIERQPAALWWDGATFHLLDGSGAFVDNVVIEDFAGLPRLSGVGAPARVGEALRLLALTPETPTGAQEEVLYAELVGERRWSLHLVGGQTVHLPEETPQVAWSSFTRLAAQHGLVSPQIESIDLRLPDRIIVHERGEDPNSAPDTEVTGEDQAT